MLCPICNQYPRGHFSKTSRKRKKLPQTCVSNDCTKEIRKRNAVYGIYIGNEKCDTCENLAQFFFKTGRKCCHISPCNCPTIRIPLNKELNTRLDANTAWRQEIAGKILINKLNNIDANGKNSIDRGNEKYKQVVESSRDEYGRSYISRNIQSLEEFLSKNEKEMYRWQVQTETDRQFRLHFYEIENAQLRGDEWHLDHIFSINEGFKQKISPEIIGHFTNLQMLSSSDNHSKNSKCHKSVDKLYGDYYSYILPLDMLKCLLS